MRNQLPQTSEWIDEGPGNSLFSGTTKEHAEVADVPAFEVQQPRGKDALNLEGDNRSSQILRCSISEPVA
jgi:hypothetical protein